MTYFRLSLYQLQYFVLVSGEASDKDVHLCGLVCAYSGSCMQYAVCTKILSDLLWKIRLQILYSTQ